MRFTDDQRRRLATRAKISELVSQEFFMRLFPPARADDSQHLHSFSLLIAASQPAIFAGPVWATPPMLSGGTWRSSRHGPHSRARGSGRLRQEMFGAREKTKPTGYEENTHRLPARPTALPPSGRPDRAFPVTRRWVPWHRTPPCSPKKGDTRASSRGPQSIPGLPSASFRF